MTNKDLELIVRLQMGLAMVMWVLVVAVIIWSILEVRESKAEPLQRIKCAAGYVITAAEWKTANAVTPIRANGPWRIQWVSNYGMVTNTVEKYPVSVGYRQVTKWACVKQ